MPHPYEENGITFHSPTNPLIVIIDKSQMIMDTLSNWTHVQLYQMMEFYQVDYQEIVDLLAKMQMTGDVMLLIDIEQYREEKEK